MNEPNEKITTLCGLCGEPMPPGEQMFNYHGFSGPCPKPPLPKPASASSTPEPKDPDHALTESHRAAGRICPECHDYWNDDPDYGAVSTCEHNKPVAPQPAPSSPTYQAVESTGLEEQAREWLKLNYNQHAADITEDGRATAWVTDIGEEEMPFTEPLVRMLAKYHAHISQEKDAQLSRVSAENGELRRMRDYWKDLNRKNSDHAEDVKAELAILRTQLAEKDSRITQLEKGAEGLERGLTWALQQLREPHRIPGQNDEYYNSFAKARAALLEYQKIKQGR